MSVRTTISLEDDLLKLLKLKAVETSTSVSTLLNEILHDAFCDDSDDLNTFKDREKEPSISFESFLQELKSDGRL
jgi:predicted DNA-binding ribbon-helix-helix protein